jgi:hypothetical protein
VLAIFVTFQVNPLAPNGDPTPVQANRPHGERQKP